MIETVDKNGDGKISFSEFRWINILHKQWAKLAGQRLDIRQLKYMLPCSGLYQRSCWFQKTFIIHICCNENFKALEKRTNARLPGWWWVVSHFSSPTTRRQKSQMGRRSSRPATVISTFVISLVLYLLNFIYMTYIFNPTTHPWHIIYLYYKLKVIHWYDISRRKGHSSTIKCNV